MRLRVRVAFPRSPLIFQLSKKNDSRRWCALHRGQFDWGEIFSSVLQLLTIKTTEFSDRLLLGDGVGEVAWQNHWWGTTINVQFSKFSERKQELVAATLLKAARQSKPKEYYANSN
jgi:hypothetical protein